MGDCPFAVGLGWCVGLVLVATGMSVVWPFVAGACLGLMPAALCVDQQWQKARSESKMLDNVMRDREQPSPRAPAPASSAPTSMFTHAALAWNSKLQEIAVNPPTLSVPDFMDSLW